MQIRCLIVGLLFVPGAFAQTTTAFDSRPATVPADYLVTPSGWFHPACVIELGEDEKLDAKGNVAGRKDDLVRRSLHRCPHPRFDRDGNETSAVQSSPPPDVNGWIVAGGATAGAMEFISANWTVPANPGSVVGQTLYFFPGIEPAATYNEILQPVLGWNTIGSGASWTISSWNCCLNQNATHSALVGVNPGATLYGYMWGTNCSTQTGVCANWQVLTSVAGGAQTTFNTDAANEVLDWSLGGVYEAYNLTACNQHSPTNGVTFTNLTARNVGGAGTAPTWVENYYNPSPACAIGYSSPASTTVAISWCAPQASCNGSTCGQTISDGCGGTVTCPACSQCRFGYTDCEGNGTVCVKWPAVCP